jgi:two-component system chemotaxis response regulator CheY
MPEARKVLVVDDSATAAKQLHRILEESGRYKVVGHAADGVEAIKQVKEHAPQIVCMDLVMPNMDGLQALRIIMSIQKDTRVVMISSVGGVADKVAECLKAGARSVLSKPFDGPKVLEVLDSV